MKQKLRATRNGIVILFAILCIVCLSLSLAFSAHFAAFAEESTLPNDDGQGHYLWKVSYTDSESNVQYEDLWNGTHEGNVILFLDGMGNVTSDGSALNCFAPYRGTEISLEINPEYLVEGTPILNKYSVTYDGDTSSVGEANRSTDMHTTATLTDGTDTINVEKDWTIASLVNSLDIENDFINGVLYYGEGQNCDEVTATYGNTVIYDFSVSDSHDNAFAVSNDPDGSTRILAVNYTEGEGYQVTETALNIQNLEEVNSEGGYFNYSLKRLNGGDYTLYVASVPFDADNGVRYVPHVAKFDFTVQAQDITDFSGFSYSIENRSPVYTSTDSWINGENGMPGIGFTLKLGNIVLVPDIDYTLSASGTEVGLVDLIITGNGSNITGSYTVSNAVMINAAANSWKNDKQPGMMSWIYGTYSPDKFVISGEPTYFDDINDICFSIVKLVEETVDGVKVLTEVAPFDGDTTLSNFHYIVKNAGESNEQWLVNDEVAAKIAALGVGKYRLIASVAANTNYHALEERRVDFDVLKGTNGWKNGSEPQILGWVAGKLSSTDGLINAESLFGTPILMIYDMDDNLIYSNLPSHADKPVGNIEVLKDLKAGRYYLSAKVDGTNDYDEIKATVLFDVTPNRLPTWAVVLIVVGSLATVAVVFIILHQKGILQMLTGKVILSMRTRANVDATLAAIRAAKMARDAQESIAAAKARDAEEEAKKAENDKK